MVKRKIVYIDEEKCNGCGLCIPNCAEGALKIIDGKAKLVSDKYCDGLGACPRDAIKIIEREADEFDEKAVEEHLARENNTQEQDDGGKGQFSYGVCGCPGSRAMILDDTGKGGETLAGSVDIEISIKPQLKQWPVQLMLVPVNAPYFENAHLLVTADCVPFAYANFHLDLLKGKSAVVGCPKLDDIRYYIDKLTEIIKHNNIKSITVAHMEVPCCSGMVKAVQEAIQASGKNVPLNTVKIGINGQREG